MKQVILWTAALTTLVYFSARGDDSVHYSVRFGPGIGQNGLTGETKAFGVRREAHLLRGLYLGNELGGYTESREGHKMTALGKLQLGVKPGQDKGLFGFAFFGPAIITATDSRLSTNFQLATDVGLGVRDYFTFISVGYGHLSNAGIKTPNKGRDYILFSMGISL